MPRTEKERHIGYPTDLPKIVIAFRHTEGDKYTAAAMLYIKTEQEGPRHAEKTIGTFRFTTPAGSSILLLLTFMVPVCFAITGWGQKIAIISVRRCQQE